MGPKGRKMKSWVWSLGPKQALQTSKHPEKVIMAPLISKLRLGSRSSFESELSENGVSGWVFPRQPEN